MGTALAALTAGMRRGAGGGVGRPPGALTLTHGQQLARPAHPYPPHPIIQPCQHSSMLRATQRLRDTHLGAGKVRAAGGGTAGAAGPPPRSPRMSSSSASLSTALAALVLLRWDKHGMSMPVQHLLVLVKSMPVQHLLARVGA